MDLSDGIAKMDLSDGIAKMDLSDGIAKMDLSPGIATMDLSDGIAKMDLSDGIAKMDLSDGIAKMDLSPGIANMDLSPNIAKMDLSPGIAKMDLSPGIATMDLSPNIAKMDLSPGIATMTLNFSPIEFPKQPVSVTLKPSLYNSLKLSDGIVRNYQLSGVYDGKNVTLTDKTNHQMYTLLGKEYRYKINDVVVFTFPNPTTGQDSKVNVKILTTDFKFDKNFNAIWTYKAVLLPPPAENYEVGVL